MIIWSYLGLIYVFYVFILFLRSLGKSLPILELCSLIAGLQWIVGAFIEYRISFDHYKYFMYVSESTYMSYVVPAYIVFSLALLRNQNRLRKFKLKIEEGKNYSNFGLRMIIFSYVTQIVSPLIPSQLDFVLFLISNLKYVGITILYFSKIKWHNKILYVIVIIFFIESLISGMFHLFFSWLVFFFMFWTYKNKTTIKTNILIVFFGLFSLSSIQIVKSDFRSFIWNNYSGNEVVLFFNLISNSFSERSIEKQYAQSTINTRLNQGWIISAIMNNTPKNQSFANGETILLSCYKALVPRVLDPFQIEIRVRDNFMKYTGIYISESTSMGMSVVGESYVNFGVFGGIVTIGFWGIFLSFVWKQLYLISLRKPFFIFFLPLIFLQVIKAETEFASVLNHLTKTIIFIFIFIWLLKFFYKIKYPIKKVTKNIVNSSEFDSF